MIHLEWCMSSILVCYFPPTVFRLRSPSRHRPYRSGWAWPHGLPAACPDWARIQLHRLLWVLYHHCYLNYRLWLLWVLDHHCDLYYRLWLLTAVSTVSPLLLELQTFTAASWWTITSSFTRQTLDCTAALWLFDQSINQSISQSASQFININQSLAGAEHKILSSFNQLVASILGICRAYIPEGQTWTAVKNKVKKQASN